MPRCEIINYVNTDTKNQLEDMDKVTGTYFAKARWYLQNRIYISIVFPFSFSIRRLFILQ